MDIHRFTLLTFLSVLLLQECSSEVYPTRKIIQNILGNDYRKQVRPRCPDEPAVSVVIDVAVRQIIELNEPEQSLKVNAWLRLRWRDCRLTWNETETGITSIILPQESVWRPDVTLYDRSDENPTSDTESFRLSVTSDGEVNFHLSMISTSICTLETTYFPFDKQTCPLTFGMWSYNGLEVNITNLNSFGDTGKYIQHEEWTLTSFEAIRDEPIYDSVPFPTVQYVLAMKRKPFFFVINLLLPCVLISFVSVLGFLLPSDNGDKNNLELTVLLALSVFQLLVLDMMPATSEAVPYISIYFASTFSLVALSCIMNVLVLTIFSKGDHGCRLPKIVKSVVIESLGDALCTRPTISNEELIFKRLLSRKRKAQLEESTEATETVGRSTENRETNLLVDVFNKLNEILNSVVSTRTSSESDDSSDWHALARILDRFFSCLYILFSIILFVVFTVEFLVGDQTSDKRL